LRPGSLHDPLSEMCSSREIGTPSPKGTSREEDQTAGGLTGLLAFGENDLSGLDDGGNLVARPKPHQLGRRARYNSHSADVPDRPLCPRLPHRAGTSPRS